MELFVATTIVLLVISLSNNKDKQKMPHLVVSSEQTK